MSMPCRISDELNYPGDPQNMLTPPTLTPAELLDNINNCIVIDILLDHISSLPELTLVELANSIVSGEYCDTGNLLKGFGDDILNYIESRND